MKLHYIIFYILLFGLFSSFSPTKACAYADSNIGYVKMEIEKAITAKNLQLARFHTYKALNAIEKSQKELEKCGCEYAMENIVEGSEHLKQATKATSLAGSGILLNKALTETVESLEALKNHEKHKSAFGNDVLTMNTTALKKSSNSPEPATEKMLQLKIDSSLVKYRKSLDKVVNTVNCREALEFANKIYDECEQQLLKPNLSEGKKYYNLKTKEITEEAIEKLRGCGNK